MSDNEKRAHDLAVAITAISMRYQFDLANAQGKSVGFDEYAEYLKNYKRFLKSANQDFPS